MEEPPDIVPPKHIKYSKEELSENPRPRTRINLTGRYLPCPTSGWRSAGAVHGLTLIPIKRGRNSYYFQCFCGSRVTLTAEFDVKEHGLTFEQAKMLAEQAASEGMGGIIL